MQVCADICFVLDGCWKKHGILKQSHTTLVFICTVHTSGLAAAEVALVCEMALLLCLD